MSTMFSKSDRDFLASVGIANEDTTFDADRLALAKHIAKHQAPAQVKVNPQADARY